MTFLPKVAYLAGPMSGKPHFNYPAFSEAAAKLRAHGIPVVSPHELHAGDTSRPWAEYLRADLRAMLDCDAIVLLRGWRESQGAQLERTVAQKVGIAVYEYADVLASLRNLAPVRVAPGGGRARPGQVGGAR